MTTIVVTGKSFREAFDSVEHAAAREPSRPILQTILLDVGESRARLVAADNYRVAIAVLVLLREADETVRLPIRRDDLLIARRVMPPKLAALSFTSEDGSTVLVSWEAFELRLPVMQGTYPNVDQIFHDAPAMIGLNPQYLGDLRRHMRKPAEALVVRIGGPTQAVIFEGAGIREAIMPVRGVVPDVVAGPWRRVGEFEDPA